MYSLSSDKMLLEVKTLNSNFWGVVLLSSVPIYRIHSKLHQKQSVFANEWLISQMAVELRVSSLLSVLLVINILITYYLNINVYSIIVNRHLM